MFRSFIKFFSVLMVSIFVSTFFTGCGSSSSDEPSGSELVSVEVTPSSSYVTVGGSEQFSATAIYSNGEAIDVSTSVVWESSNTAVATVNESGVAHGTNAGSVNISAKYISQETAVSGFATLDVTADEILDPINPTLKSVHIEGNDIISVGETEDLELIATLTDNTKYVVNDKANWSSSNPSIATVDSNGVVTAIASSTSDNKTVVITASGKVNSSIVATHTMTVTDATLKSIQIEDGYSPDSPTPIDTITINVDEEKYITAWGIFSDDTRHYINTEVIWRTADRSIASMNTIQSSKVKGVSAGTTTVTATSKGISESINVTVVGATLKSIQIQKNYDANGNGEVLNTSDNPLNLVQEDVQYITAWAVYDDDSKVYINTEVFWKSDNQGVASMDIAQRNSNVTGVSEGQAVVSAKYEGMTGEATVNVYGASIQ